jgi:hypothetical protein
LSNVAKVIKIVEIAGNLKKFFAKKSKFLWKNNKFVKLGTQTAIKSARVVNHLHSSSFLAQKRMKKESSSGLPSQRFSYSHMRPHSTLFHPSTTTTMSHARNIFKNILSSVSSTLDLAECRREKNWQLEKASEDKKVEK